MIGTHDDPADLLRAVAAESGALAVECVTVVYRGTGDYPVERVTLDALQAAHHARRAWRYALAARLLTNVAAILHAEPTPPAAPSLHPRAVCPLCGNAGIRPVEAPDTTAWECLACGRTFPPPAL